MQGPALEIVSLMISPYTQAQMLALTHVQESSSPQRPGHTQTNKSTHEITRGLHLLIMCGLAIFFTTSKHSVQSSIAFTRSPVYMQRRIRHRKAVTPTSHPAVWPKTAPGIFQLNCSQHVRAQSILNGSARSNAGDLEIHGRAT